jgi:signal transduction histidine kinase
MIAGQRRRLLSTLVDRAQRLARERDQQAEIATARERERIAREMHDVIAHSLSVMIALADGARAAADDRPGEAKDVMGRVAQTGRRTLGEVRRLLGSVRGDPSDPALHAPQPDASQLAALVAESVAAGLPVRLTETGPRPGDPAVGLSVYRIVQESLTNVLRHASDVEDVSVEVAWSTDAVSVVVRDRSAPVAPADGAGRGILGMRERAALFDGEATAGPHSGGGWQVRARLHWEEEGL